MSSDEGVDLENSHETAADISAMGSQKLEARIGGLATVLLNLGC